MIADTLRSHYALGHRDHMFTLLTDQKHGVIAGLKEKLKTLPTQPLNVEELICPNVEDERKKLLIKPVKPVAAGKKK